MLNSGSPVTAGLLSAAPGQAGATRPSSPTVTIQSGGATAAGAVAGCGGGASAGKSAANATPDATISNPTEMGHEADDMTTPTQLDPARLLEQIRPPRRAHLRQY